MCDDERTLKALQALLTPLQAIATHYADLARDVDDLRAMMTEVQDTMRLSCFLQQMLWLHPAHKLVRVGLNPRTFTEPVIPPVRKPVSAGVQIPAAE